MNDLIVAASSTVDSVQTPSLIVAYRPLCTIELSDGRILTETDERTAEFWPAYHAWQNAPRSAIALADLQSSIDRVERHIDESIRAILDESTQRQHAIWPFLLALTAMIVVSAWAWIEG